MKSEHNYPRGVKKERVIFSLRSFPERISKNEKREREPVIIAGIEKLPTERRGMELPWLATMEVVGISVRR